MTKRTKDSSGGPHGAGAGNVDGVEEATFEERLKALERVVARLESDDVPLEEAITLYEDGMKLHQACEKVLAEAQVRIEKLARPGRAENGA